MINEDSPPIRKVTKTKKYQLILIYSYSGHAYGNVVSEALPHVYLTLEECQNAGREARDNFVGTSVLMLSFTCVPFYKTSVL